MTQIIWLVALLSLSLPSGYRLDGKTSEQVALPGPPGMHATEEFRSWKAPDGKALYLFFWKPFAPRDLGPMKAIAEWPATVAGQKTKVYETSMFMGREQHVLVTYLHFKNPDANAMLYASGIDRREFMAILSGIRIVKTR